MTVMTKLRRRGSATAALLLVPALAACGFGVQTNQQYQAGAGVDNRDGVVQILNAAVVLPQAGATNGVFVGSFVNTSGSDPALQANYAAGQTATVESISITHPSGGTVDPHITLAPTSAYNPQPTSQPGDHGVPITVPADLTQGGNPADGAYVTMAFVISTGGAKTITMRVPVFLASSANNYWAQYLPASTGTPTPTTASPTP